MHVQYLENHYYHDATTYMLTSKFKIKFQNSLNIKHPSAFDPSEPDNKPKTEAYV
jgi:hypothetical protein